MYCSSCGTVVAPGISFCNRCGQSLKEPDGPRPTAAITAFLVAITLIGTIGLGIMLGGAISLKKEANMADEMVGIFMLFSFFVVATIEILLIRQLSKLTGARAPKQPKFISPPQMGTHELPAHQPRPMVESVPSVTENTTRTLQYSRNEQTR